LVVAFVSSLESFFNSSLLSLVELSLGDFEGILVLSYLIFTGAKTHESIASFFLIKFNNDNNDELRLIIIIILFDFSLIIKKNNSSII